MVGLPQNGAGHVGHSSVEMLLRKPVNHKNDIWALGITLAELYTGRLIWEQGDMEAEVSTLERNPSLATVDTTHNPCYSSQNTIGMKLNKGQNNEKHPPLVQAYFLPPQTGFQTLL